MVEATGLRYNIRVIDGGLALGITMAYIPHMGSPEGLASALAGELRQRNVVFGLDNQAILDIMRERKIGEETVIATGKPARRGRDAAVEIVLEPPSFAAATDGSGRVDYKNVENVAEVKAGELISRGTPADLGEPGTNVFGKEIRPPAVRERVRHPAGRNTEISTDGLEMRAAKDGFLRWNGERIDVADIYLVRGDVDLRIGNIRYQGDVEILGSVQTGFQVVGGGDVRVLGSLDGGSVISEGGRVTILGGVLGSSEAPANVAAEGDIQVGRARFARLESRSGSIIANSAMEHSEIHAAGDLLLRSGPAMSCVVDVGGKVDVNKVSSGSVEVVDAGAKAEQPAHGNRRKHLRVIVSRPVAVQILHDQRGTVEGALQDVSAGGARVRLRGRLIEGSRYRLQFKLPAVDGTMWMDAEVVRTCEPPNGQDPAGETSYGLQYVHIEPAVREALAKYCLAEDLRQRRLTG